MEYKKIAEVNGIIFGLVDGDDIRDTYDVDFTMGGHHYKYNWIPENLILIEDLSNFEDIFATSIHELFERFLMKYRGLIYDKAHEIANILERRTRKCLSQLLMKYEVF